MNGGASAGVQVVIDASVAVKWFLPGSENEPDVDRAMVLLEGLRDGEVRAVQPPHWLAEVSAVIARLRPSLAQQAVELLVALELPIEEGLDSYRCAIRIATDLEHHLFDTLYHAIAVEREIVLISADDHYCRKAKRLGGLQELRDWQPPA